MFWKVKWGLQFDIETDVCMFNACDRNQNEVDYLMILTCLQARFCLFILIRKINRE